MWRLIRGACDAAMERDPAARSRLEVLLCYPSVWAIVFHRISHWFWVRGWCLWGRWLSQVARFFTGIEIHPGARVGRGVFIDHGMGVVIGETAILGDDVTLYQGVTLGGVMPAVDSALQRSVKRHPTLGKGVIVGSGAQILGDIEIGSYAKVGANAVVTKPVASGAVVVGNPAQEVKREVSVDSAEGLGGREESFVPYGHVKDCASHHDIFERMERWEKRMEVLEKAYKESARKGEGEEVDS